jgi:hypothetical protein
LALSLLLGGGPLIFISMWLPSWWLFNCVALGQTFGPERPPGVKVEHVTKPYTVTFSNGKTVDVGPLPAIMSSLCHLGIGIPAALAYFYIGKRLGPEWYRSGKWRRQGVSIIED